MRRLLTEAYTGWWNDRAMSMGAAIAFYTVFSLAPILFAAIAVAGLVFGREAAQGAIVLELGGLLGEKASEAIEQMIASADDVGSGILGTVFGLGTFLLLVSGAIVELQDDLNIIWKVERRPTTGIAEFVRVRLLSFVLVLGIGFLLMVSLVIDAGLSALNTYMEQTISGISLLQISNQVFSAAVSWLLFAMMFKILPDVELTWRDVAMGSFVTAILFTLGKYLIGFYLGTSAVASSYGAAGSIITLLLWIYYTSLILLYGAEFTKVYAESRGSRIGKARSGTPTTPVR
jgi:membrane protein